MPVTFSYRVEIRVPEALADRTTWRAIVPPRVSYDEAVDCMSNLRSSLLFWGFGQTKVDQWLAENARCVEYRTKTARTREIPLTYWLDKS